MTSDNLQRKMCQIRQEGGGTCVNGFDATTFTGIQIVLEVISQFA